MTFIHATKQKSFLTRLIVALMIALFTGTAGLVLLYNKVVDLNHSIAQAKSQLEAIGTASTQLNDQIVAIIGGGGFTNAAVTNGLVLDQNPQYFAIAATALAPASQKSPLAVK